jgi:hypothetical protein
MVMCRLYLDLVRSLDADYFPGLHDSYSLKVVGIYVYVRTMMGVPTTSSATARWLDIPRGTVLRRLEELIKLGYVKRAGKAYVTTDKVDLPDIERKVKRRINMIITSAKKLSEMDKPA